MKKQKYYSIRKMYQLYPDAQYYVVYGQRSNGKTYSPLELCLEEYFLYGYQFAYIRRWKDDVRITKMRQLFSGIVRDNLVYKYSKGKWDDIEYNSRAFYLVKHNEDGTTTVSETPICFIFVLTEEEHDKGFEAPLIQNIFFDEFIARGRYLPDEFITFSNVLSTIIRDRGGIKIFMSGNTINRFSPYFKEMGLTNVKNQKAGTIDVYTYGESGLKVVVEYADFPDKKKKSDIYFAFNNPKLQMITRGAWEIAVYPHLTPDMKYLPKDVKYFYFIVFDDTTLQCDIVKKNNYYFTFVHLKTSPIKDDNTNLVYTLSPNPKPNYRKNITRPFSNAEKIIIDMFKRDKVFYQNNEIGDVVRNYMLNCTQPIK